MTEFYPVGCMIDELNAEEYLLLLDWAIVHNHPIDQPNLAWHCQYSLQWWSELTMFRIICEAERRLARKWYRRLWIASKTEMRFAWRWYRRLWRWICRRR